MISARAIATARTPPYTHQPTTLFTESLRLSQQFLKKPKIFPILSTPPYEKICVCLPRYPERALQIFIIHLYDNKSIILPSL